MKELIEQFQESILALFDIVRKEDGADREAFIPKIRKNILYWRRAQDLFWSETAGDFRSMISEISTLNDRGVDTENFNYKVNITRAHGESIVSAVATSMPSVHFLPDDADNPQDLAATDEYDKAVKLLQKHNNASQLFMKWAYTYYNQGMVAIYNYHKKDNAYGSYQVDIYDKRKVQKEDNTCPECGEDLNESEPHMEERMVSEDPENMMMEPVEMRMCQGCNGPVTPMKETYEEEEEYLKAQETRPKGRECVEIYGPLNVMIPLDAREQSKIPYLLFEEEVHPSLAKDLYPAFKEDITVGPASGTEDYYRFARRILAEESSQAYRTTIGKLWIRPFFFNALGEEKCAELKEVFPEGMLVCIINRQVVHLEADSLDAHWTISSNPTSDYLQAEPPASDMNDIQDLENDMTNLTATTIFRGIPQNFADPNVLDFDAYQKTENEPGMTFPAEGRFGQPLSAAFYQTRSATVSKDVEMFRQDLNRKGQFVSGDMPAIHGGANTFGSKTLGEYELSKSQALQRLGIIYKTGAAHWRIGWGKATFSYCAHLAEDGYDDRMVSRGKDGRPRNTNVSHKAIASGKVGGVETEADPSFPLSWEQFKALIMQLVGLGMENVNATIFHPSNIDIVSRALGLGELHIPGKEDVRSELEAIKMIMDESIPVPIDTELDDPKIHSQVLKEFLLGPEGRMLKLEEPDKYQMILDRFRQYAMILKMQIQQAMIPQGAKPPMPPMNQAEAPSMPGPPEVKLPIGAE